MPATNFLWDEVNDSYLAETGGTGAEVALYDTEPGPFGRLISQERGGVTSHYHFDGQGSTRQLTDENENVTDTATYTAFGETVGKTGATVNPFGYKGAAGYYANPETENVYVRARVYSPLIARWLTLDPLGFWDGISLYQADNFYPGLDMRRYWNPASEPYVYIGNNPTNFVDPSGLERSFCGDSDFKPYIDPVDLIDGKPVIDMKEVIGKLWVTASIDAASAPTCGATPIFPDSAFLRVFFHGFHTKKFNPLTAMEVVSNDYTTTACKHNWSTTGKSMTSEWHCPLQCEDNECRAYRFQSIIYLKSKSSGPNTIPIYYTRPGQMIAIEARASFDSTCCLINSCKVEARVCQLLNFGIPNSQSLDDPPPTMQPNLAPGVPGIIAKHCGPWQK